MKKFKNLTFNKILVLGTLIPLIVSLFIAISVCIQVSKTEVTTMNHNYMLSIAELEGQNLQAYISDGNLEALSSNFLSSFCKNISMTDIDSSYCYVVNTDGIMLYHPTESKIGQPVSNEAIQNICAELKAGKMLENQVVEYTFDRTTKYSAYYISPTKDFVLVVSADKKDIMHGINMLAANCVVCELILATIFGALTFFYAKKVSNPLEQITSAMHELSTGNLSLNTTVNSHIKETKQLVDSFTTLKNALQSSIGTIVSSSNKLTDSIDNVNAKTISNADNVSQISETVNEIAKTAEEVASSAQTLAEHTVVFEKKMETMTNSANDLNMSSENIKTANASTKEVIDNVVCSAEQSSQSVKNIIDNIHDTNDAIQKIVNLTDVINDIATQTKILSLNASIEAARAGDAGKGFSVVAESIRNLAESTNENAKSIRQVIDEIVELSKKTVDGAQLVKESVETEQKALSRTVESSENLSSAVEKSFENIQILLNEINTLNLVKEELINSTSNLSAVSEELGASSEEINASCQTVSNACEQTKTQANKMKNISIELAQAVTFFSLNEE